MLQIRQNISLIRNVSGKTQEEFSRLFGFSVAQIKSYEGGKARPNGIYLSRLAKFAGVSLVDIKNKELTEDDINIGVVEKVERTPTTVTAETDHDYETGNLTMKALVNLTESNRVLAESNKTLAESHSRLVTMVETKSTESGPQEIPEAVDAKLTDALVLLAEIGSGKKWKSVQEGLAEIHKRFSGVHRTVEVKGIQKRGDKLHKEK